MSECSTTCDLFARFGASAADKLLGLAAELGVAPLINASAPKSNLSGPPLSDEIASIVGEAQKWCFDLADLNRRAGSYCAGLLGGENGAVTGGTSAGILLALETAKKMKPGFAGAPEVIIRRGDFGHYAYLFNQAGCALREVGNIVSCSSDEVEAAFTERTIAVGVVLSPRLPQAELSLGEVVKLAKDHGVPVIADCAAIFPSRKRIADILTTGCHAVLLSGGKVLGGPQASGLLIGEAAFVETAHLLTFPSDGPLRAVKLDRGQILGLAAAVSRFSESSPESLQAQFQERCEAGLRAIGRLDGATVSIVPEILIEQVPMISVEDTSGLGHQFFEDLSKKLLVGRLPIGFHYIKARRIVCLSPIGLLENQMIMVCDTFRNKWEELTDDRARGI